MAKEPIQKNEEIDWERIKESDLDKEEVIFEISKDAFDDKISHCQNCNILMERRTVNVPLIGTQFSARIDAFVCRKCNKTLLNGVQANRLDKLLRIVMALKAKQFGIERSLNFDGRSVFIRLPKEFKKYKDAKARIVPLEEKKLLIEIE